MDGPSPLGYGEYADPDRTLLGGKMRRRGIGLAIRSRMQRLRK